MREGWVDYLCSSLFGAGLPGLPKIREFVQAANKTQTGIYPTLWSLDSWQQDTCPQWVSITLKKESQRALGLYKDDLCTAALRMYEEGADGISTFNWYCHLINAAMPHIGPEEGQYIQGRGAHVVQTHIYPLLKDPAALRRYREEPWAVPPRG